MTGILWFKAIDLSVETKGTKSSNHVVLEFQVITEKKFPKVTGTGAPR